MTCIYLHFACTIANITASSTCSNKPYYIHWPDNTQYNYMYMKRAGFADASRKLSMDRFFNHVLMNMKTHYVHSRIYWEILLFLSHDYKLSLYILNLNSFNMITAFTLAISALSTVSMYHSFIMVKYLY